MADAAAAQQGRRLGGAGAEEYVLGVDADELALAALALELCDHARDSVVLRDEQAHVAPGEQPSPRGFRPWNEALAHALLGAPGASGGALVRAAATRGSARHLLGGPAHGVDAALEDLGALGP